MIPMMKGVASFVKVSGYSLHVYFFLLYTTHSLRSLGGIGYRFILIDINELRLFSVNILLDSFYTLSPPTSEGERSEPRPTHTRKGLTIWDICAYIL